MAEINTSTSSMYRGAQTTAAQHNASVTSSLSTQTTILENYNLSSWNNIEAYTIYGNCMLCTVKCNTTWCSFISTAHVVTFIFSLPLLLQLFCVWLHFYSFFFAAKIRVLRQFSGANKIKKWFFPNISASDFFMDRKFDSEYSNTAIWNPILKLLYALNSCFCAFS